MGYRKNQSDIIIMQPNNWCLSRVYRFSGGVGVYDFSKMMQWDEERYITRQSIAMVIPPETPKINSTFKIYLLGHSEENPIMFSWVLWEFFETWFLKGISTQDESWEAHNGITRPHHLKDGIYRVSMDATSLMLSEYKME